MDYLQFKKKLKEENKKPKIIVKSKNEYTNIINNFRKNIKECIANLNIETKFNNSYYYSLISDEIIEDLPKHLEKELNILTNNTSKIWCKKNSLNICTLIGTSIDAINNINFINKFEYQKICEYILEYIFCSFSNIYNDKFYILYSSIKCPTCKEINETYNYKECSKCFSPF